MRTAGRPSAFLTLLKVPSNKSSFSSDLPPSPTSPGYTSVSTASSPTDTEFETETPPASPVRPVRPSFTRRIATLLTVSGPGPEGKFSVPDLGEIELGAQGDDENDSDDDVVRPKRKSFYVERMDLSLESLGLGRPAPSPASLSSRRGSGRILSLDLSTLTSFPAGEDSLGVAGHRNTPQGGLGLAHLSRPPIRSIRSADFLSPLKSPPAFASADDSDAGNTIPNRVDTPITLDPPPLQASWRKRPSHEFQPSLQPLGSPLSSPSDDEVMEKMLDVFEPRTITRRCPKGPRIRPVGGFFPSIDYSLPLPSIHILTQDISPLDLPAGWGSRKVDSAVLKAADPADVPPKSPRPPTKDAFSPPSDVDIVFNTTFGTSCPSPPAVFPQLARPLPHRSSFHSRLPLASDRRASATSSPLRDPSRPPVRRRSSHFQPPTTVATPLGLISPSGLPRTLGRSASTRLFTAATPLGLGGGGLVSGGMCDAGPAGLLAPVSTPLDLFVEVGASKPWHGPKTPPKQVPEEHTSTPYAFSPDELAQKLELVTVEDIAEEKTMEQDGNPYFWGASA